MLKKAGPALIVGLGNPASYSSSRHNVGKALLDSLIQSYSKASYGHHSVYEGHIVLKPEGYMNLIGAPVREAMRKFERQVTHLVVIQDDIDQSFGKVKVKRGGSASGHNGVISIIEKLRSDQFIRIKIGVGRPQSKDDVADYVLSPFNSMEQETLHNVVFPLCVKKLQEILAEFMLSSGK